MKKNIIEISKAVEFFNFIEIFRNCLIISGIILK